jgi:hypothetical protein
MFRNRSLQIGLWIRPVRVRRGRALWVRCALSAAMGAGVGAVVMGAARSAAPTSVSAPVFREAVSLDGAARMIDAVEFSHGAMHRITVPGEHRLTVDVVGEADGHGFVIAADGVTLDLGGRTMRGDAMSLAGVYIQAGRQDVTVRNGTIIGWGAEGVRADDAARVRLENVTLLHNGASGAVLGDHAVVRSVRAESHRGRGVIVGRWSSLEDVHAAHNDRCGIVAGLGSRVENVRSRFNGGNGLTLAALGEAEGATLERNGAYGAAAGKSSRLQNCEASGNGAAGFRLGGDGIAVGCVALDNGSGGFTLGPGARAVDSRPRP